jgi:uncharacterized membrane protein YhaH (DUF805 family)
MTPASDLQGNDPRPMDFRFLFLEPQGRLAPKPFGRGLVLLTGGGMIISVLTAVVSPGLNVLQYALVFPYICLFGKRLHDAGLTAWLWIAFLAGLGFLNMFLSAMLLPVLSPGAFAIQVVCAPVGGDDAGGVPDLQRDHRLCRVPPALGPRTQPPRPADPRRPGRHVQLIPSQKASTP